MILMATKKNYTHPQVVILFLYLKKKKKSTSAKVI